MLEGSDLGDLNLSYLKNKNLRKSNLFNFLKNAGFNFNSIEKIKKSIGINNFSKNIITDINIKDYITRNSISPSSKYRRYMNILKLIKNRSHRGGRHLKGMPVNNQSSKKNAKTRKKRKVI